MERYLVKEGLSITESKQIKENLNLCVISSADEYYSFYKKIFLYAIEHGTCVDLHLSFRQDPKFFIKLKVNPESLQTSPCSRKLIYWPKNLKNEAQAKTISSNAVFLPANCGFKLGLLHLLLLENEAILERDAQLMQGLRNRREEFELKLAASIQEDLAHREEYAKSDLEFERQLAQLKAVNEALKNTLKEAEGTPFYNEAWQLFERGSNCRSLKTKEFVEFLAEIHDLRNKALASKATASNGPCTIS